MNPKYKINSTTFSQEWPIYFYISCHHSPEAVITLYKLFKTVPVVKKNVCFSRDRSFS